MKTHNPNFTAYAMAHGNTPEKQLEIDTELWPGGKMCGFVLWISEMKRAFYKKNPGAFYDRNVIGDIKAWEAFLVRVAKETKL
jgi:hypothetical protein